MHASIIYVTSRPDPRLDWLLDDLTQQHQHGDDLELIIIDSLRRTTTDLGYRDVPGVSRWVCSPPKPTPWQGPQRLTRQDWWALSSARNTGIVLAQADYVAFLDDRCHLGPHWLRTLRRGARERRSVIAGAYKKIEQGKTTVDHRLLQRPAGGSCGGNWLYGCTLAAPTQWLLEVNGFEEGCDGLSGEDYILGLMLQNRGRPIEFCPDLLVVQERDAGTGHGMVRRDKGVSPNDKSHAALKRFGNRDHTEFTPDLNALRACVRATGKFPDVDSSTPQVDWFDEQPIADMEPS